MGWLNKLKALITRKNKSNKEEGKKQFLPPVPKKMKKEKVNPSRKIRECGVCRGEILPDETMRKEPGTGMYFHTLCIKEAKKFISISI